MQHITPPGDVMSSNRPENCTILLCALITDWQWLQLLQHQYLAHALGKPGSLQNNNNNKKNLKTIPGDSNLGGPEWVVDMRDPLRALVEEWDAWGYALAEWVKPFICSRAELTVGPLGPPFLQHKLQSEVLGSERDEKGVVSMQKREVNGSHCPVLPESGHCLSHSAHSHSSQLHCVWLNQEAPESLSAELYPYSTSAKMILFHWSPPIQRFLPLLSEQDPNKCFFLSPLGRKGSCVPNSFSIVLEQMSRSNLGPKQLVICSSFL